MSTAVTIQNSLLRIGVESTPVLREPLIVLPCGRDGMMDRVVGGIVILAVDLILLYVKLKKILIAPCVDFYVYHNINSMYL